MPQPVEPGGPIFPGFPIRRFSPAAQQAAPTPQNEDAPRASADSLAIMLELAVDNESKLTGTVTFVVTDEKVAVEAGKLNGKTVTFNTTRRLSGNTTVTTWSGELTAQKTLTVRRASSTTSLPDLVFHRLQ
jgi:hypothetical protein